MLWIEIRKNTVSIIFLLAAILMAGFTFLWISPETEYYYSKPLSAGEYTYFKLKEEMNRSAMLVYGGEEGNGLPVDLELNEEIRDRIRNIIVKINPQFDENEKMSDVKIKLGDEEILKLIREFESIIGYRTNYHYGEKSGLYAVYKYKRFGINKLNEDRRNTIEEERADFEAALDTGLAEGYARYFMNYLGILAGLMSAIISAAIFIKDKQNNISEFLYASNSKSSKIVITRAVSAVLPLYVVTLIITMLGLLYFYNESKGYGYNISCLPFLKYWLIWIAPTILITTALSICLDILFSNMLIVIGIQFVLWLFSVATFVGNYEIWRIIIRFSSFGMAKYYGSIKNSIYINRIFMVFSSIFIIAVSIYLFDRARNGKRLRIKAINNIMKYFTCRLNLKRRRTQGIKSKGFLFYQLKLACNKNVIISILALVLLLIYFTDKGMAEFDIKTTGENIIIFISMFTLIPLCNIEKKNGVSEFTYISGMAYAKIFFVRFLIGIIMVMGLITASLYLMSVLNNITFGWWFLSICISSLYLGLFGAVFSEAAGKDIAGYISYLGYYLFCAIGKKNIKLFNVCCYTNGLKYSVISLIAGIYIMAVILFFIVKGKESGRE